MACNRPLQNLNLVERGMSRLALLVLLVACALALPVTAQDQTVHIVAPGDNLFRIAQEYGVSVNAIAAANNIANTWQIAAGQRLIIPPRTADTLPEQPAADPAAPTPVPAASAEPRYHVIQYGDSLGTIATRYGMTLRQLMDLNGIQNPNLIYAGQRLIVTPNTDSTAPAETTSDLPVSIVPSGTTHTVQDGERLSQIAQLYGVSWLAIAELNGITDPNLIQAGQVLTIPAATNSAVAPLLTIPNAPAATRTTGREIIVDLSDFRAYAYEDGRLVRSVLVSTGREGTPTVQGSYTIERKYEAQTMSGPGYYLPDVPYVMYFYAGYAFHGTYWHDTWGARMSHGCVNLPTPEAQWFYQFAEIGTPVTVQV
jgi:LysM repeat protein